MVRLGHINYLNCIPVHGGIITGKIPFDGKLVFGTPTQLNKMLELGKIDVSPSSSAEVLKGYKVLPALSISGKVDVKSIILVTKKPVTEIKAGLFYVTSHSATSVLLLKVILKEFYGIKAEYQVFDPETHSLSSLIKDAEGVLFIGDYALQLKNTDTFFNTDLAEVWYKNTGLPFTFALWQLNKSLTDPAVIKYVYETLKASFSYFKENSLQLAEMFSDQFKMTPKDILMYWDSLSFELNESHLKSLGLYFKLAKKHCLIEKEPIIDIVKI